MWPKRDLATFVDIFITCDGHYGTNIRVQRLQKLFFSRKKSFVRLWLENLTHRSPSDRKEQALRFIAEMRVALLAKDNDKFRETFTGTLSNRNKALVQMFFIGYILRVPSFSPGGVSHLLKIKTDILTKLADLVFRHIRASHNDDDIRDIFTYPMENHAITNEQSTHTSFMEDLDDLGRLQKIHCQFELDLMDLKLRQEDQNNSLVKEMSQLGDMCMVTDRCRKIILCMLGGDGTINEVKEQFAKHFDVDFSVSNSPKDRKVLSRVSDAFLTRAEHASNLTDAQLAVDKDRAFTKDILLFGIELMRIVCCQALTRLEREKITKECNAAKHQLRRSELIEIFCSLCQKIFVKSHTFANSRGTIYEFAENLPTKPSVQPMFELMHVVLPDQSSPLGKRDQSPLVIESPIRAKSFKHTNFKTVKDVLFKEVHTFSLEGTLKDGIHVNGALLTTDIYAVNGHDVDLVQGLMDSVGGYQMYCLEIKGGCGQYGIEMIRMGDGHMIYVDEKERYFGGYITHDHLLVLSKDICHGNITFQTKNQQSLNSPIIRANLILLKVDEELIAGKAPSRLTDHLKIPGNTQIKRTGWVEGFLSNLSILGMHNDTPVEHFLFDPTSKEKFMLEYK